jgi:hypothetical protein
MYTESLMIVAGFASWAIMDLLLAALEKENRKRNQQPRSWE